MQLRVALARLGEVRPSQPPKSVSTNASRSSIAAPSASATAAAVWRARRSDEVSTAAIPSGASPPTSGAASRAAAAAAWSWPSDVNSGSPSPEYRCRIDSSVCPWRSSSRRVGEPTWPVQAAAPSGSASSSAGSGGSVTSGSGATVTSGSSAGIA